VVCALASVLSQDVASGSGTVWVAIGNLLEWEIRNGEIAAGGRPRRKLPQRVFKLLDAVQQGSGAGNFTSPGEYHSRTEAMRIPRPFNPASASPTGQF
jgi:hypothetical protein